jgi:hypothetical protein
MIMSYSITTRGEEERSELVFRVDEDDTETRKYLEGFNVIVGPRLQGYRSLPLFFNELVAAATGDVLLCGNDDMVFKTSGWATKILKKANTFPDGIFDLGVSTHNETHFPFSIVSRRAVDTMGFLFDPQIFWGDIFLRDVMAYFGRSIMIPDVEILHNWMGHTPDPTFQQGEETRRSSWMENHPTAVNRAIERLKVIHG